MSRPVRRPPRPAVRNVRAVRAVRAASALLLAGALALSAGCAACPPSWAATAPSDGAYHYGVGQSGEVFVEADALNIALTRAARSIADALGLDVETRLSVVLVEQELFVEAWTPRGPTDALDDLQLVDRAVCADPDGGERIWVLLRLPAGGAAGR